MQVTSNARRGSHWRAREDRHTDRECRHYRPMHHWEYPVEAWKRVIEVNLNGVFYCNRALVPHMLSQGYGGS